MAQDPFRVLRARQEAEREALGTAGFAEGFGQTAYGTDRSLWDFMPFVGAGRSFKHVEALENAMDRASRGIADGDDQMLIRRFYEENYRSRSWTHTVGRVAAEAIPFAGEFFVGGAALKGAAKLASLGANAGRMARFKALGDKLALPFQRYNKYTQRLIEEAPVRGWLLKGATVDAPGQMVSQYAIGSMVGGSRIRAQQYNNYLAHRYDVKIDGADVAVRVADDSYGMWSNALPSAVIDNYIEMFSESSGMALMHMPASAKLAMLGKTGKRARQALERRLNSDKVMSFLGLSPDPQYLKYWSDFGFQGLVPEIGEEFIGAFARDAVAAVAPGLQDPGNTMHLIENLPAITLGMGLGMFGPATLHSGHNHVDMAIARSKFSPEQAEAFKELASGIQDPAVLAKLGRQLLNVENMLNFAGMAPASGYVAVDDLIETRFLRSSQVDQEAKRRITDRAQLNSEEADLSEGAVDQEKLRMLDEVRELTLDGGKPHISPVLDRLTDLGIISENEAGTLLRNFNRRIGLLLNAKKNGTIEKLLDEIGATSMRQSFVSMLAQGMTPGDNVSLRAGPWRTARQVVENIRGSLQSSPEADWIGRQGMIELVKLGLGTPLTMEARRAGQRAAEAVMAENQAIGMAYKDLIKRLQEKASFKVRESAQPVARMTQAVSWARNAGIPVLGFEGEPGAPMAIWDSENRVLWMDQKKIRDRAAKQTRVTPEGYEAVVILHEMVHVHVQRLGPERAEEWLRNIDEWLVEAGIFRESVAKEMGSPLYNGMSELARLEESVAFRLQRFGQVLVAEEAEPPTGWRKLFDFLVNALLDWAAPRTRLVMMVSKQRDTLADAGIDVNNLSDTQVVMQVLTVEHLQQLLSIRQDPADVIYDTQKQIEQMVASAIESEDQPVAASPDPVPEHYEALAAEEEQEIDPALLDLAREMEPPAEELEKAPEPEDVPRNITALRKQYRRQQALDALTGIFGVEPKTAEGKVPLTRALQDALAHALGVRTVEGEELEQLSQAVGLNLELGGGAYGTSAQEAQQQLDFAEAETEQAEAEAEGAVDEAPEAEQPAAAEAPEGVEEAPAEPGRARDSEAVAEPEPAVAEEAADQVEPVEPVEAVEEAPAEDRPAWLAEPVVLDDPEAHAAEPVQYEETAEQRQMRIDGVRSSVIVGRGRPERFGDIEGYQGLPIVRQDPDSPGVVRSADAKKGIGRGEIGRRGRYHEFSYDAEDTPFVLLTDQLSEEQRKRFQRRHAQDYDDPSQIQLHQSVPNIPREAMVVAPVAAIVDERGDGQLEGAEVGQVFAVYRVPLGGQDEVLSYVVIDSVSNTGYVRVMDSDEQGNVGDLPSMRSIPTSDLYIPASITRVSGDVPAIWDNQGRLLDWLWDPVEAEDLQPYLLRIQSRNGPEVTIDLRDHRLEQLPAVVEGALRDYLSRPGSATHKAHEQTMQMREMEADNLAEIMQRQEEQQEKAEQGAVFGFERGALTSSVLKRDAQAWLIPTMASFLKENESIVRQAITFGDDGYVSIRRGFLRQHLRNQRKMGEGTDRLTDAEAERAALAAEEGLRMMLDPLRFPLRQFVMTGDLTTLARVIDETRARMEKLQAAETEIQAKLKKGEKVDHKDIAEAQMARGRGFVQVQLLEQFMEAAQQVRLEGETGTEQSGQIAEVVSSEAVAIAGEEVTEAFGEGDVGAAKAQRVTVSEARAIIGRMLTLNVGTLQARLNPNELKAGDIQAPAFDHARPNRTNYAWWVQWSATTMGLSAHDLNILSLASVVIPRGTDGNEVGEELRADTGRREFRYSMLTRLVAMYGSASIGPVVEGKWNVEMSLPTPPLSDASAEELASVLFDGIGVTHDEDLVREMVDLIATENWPQLLKVLRENKQIDIARQLSTVMAQREEVLRNVIPVSKAQIRRLGRQLSDLEEVEKETAYLRKALPVQDRGNATRTYAGVGNRNASLGALTLATRVARALSGEGYDLNTGNAKGADAAFAEGADRPQRFSPNDVLKQDEGTQEMLWDLVRRSHENPDALQSEIVQNLTMRNAFQVFGADLQTPVDFVLAISPNGETKASERVYRGRNNPQNTGGTGQAIAIADMYHIPVINLYNKNGTLKNLADVLAEIREVQKLFTRRVRLTGKERQTAGRMVAMESVQAKLKAAEKTRRQSWLQMSRARRNAEKFVVEWVETDRRLKAAYDLAVFVRMTMNLEAELLLQKRAAQGMVDGTDAESGLATIGTATAMDLVGRLQKDIDEIRLVRDVLRRGNYGAALEYLKKRHDDSPGLQIAVTSAFRQDNPSYLEEDIRSRAQKGYGAVMSKRGSADVVFVLDPFAVYNPRKFVTAPIELRDMEQDDQKGQADFERRGMVGALRKSILDNVQLHYGELLRGLQAILEEEEPGTQPFRARMNSMISLAKKEVGDHAAAVEIISRVLKAAEVEARKPSANRNYTAAMMAAVNDFLKGDIVLQEVAGESVIVVTSERTGAQVYLAADRESTGRERDNLTVSVSSVGEVAPGGWGELWPVIFSASMEMHSVADAASKQRGRKLTDLVFNLEGLSGKAFAELAGVFTKAGEAKVLAGDVAAMGVSDFNRSKRRRSKKARETLKFMADPFYDDMQDTSTLHSDNGYQSPQMWDAQKLPKGTDASWSANVFLLAYDDWFRQMNLATMDASRMLGIRNKIVEDFVDEEGVTGMKKWRRMDMIHEALLLAINTEGWLTEEGRNLAKKLGMKLDKVQTHEQFYDMFVRRAIRSENQAEGQPKYRHLTKRQEEIVAIAIQIREGQGKWRALGFEPNRTPNEYAGLAFDLTTDAEATTRLAKDAGLIKKTQRFYVNLSWIGEDNTPVYTRDEYGLVEMGAAGGPFRLDVGARKLERGLIGVIDGWQRGLRLQRPRAIDNVHQNNRLIREVVFNRAMKTGLELSGIIMPIKDAGVFANWKPLKHRVFRGYQAPEWVAKYLNNALTQYGIRDIESGFYRNYMRLTIAAKHMMLMFGFFHHQAFMRSYLFTVRKQDAFGPEGVRGLAYMAKAALYSYGHAFGMVSNERLERIAQKWTPYRVGSQHIEEMAPELEMGVEEGLTIQKGNEIIGNPAGALYELDDEEDADAWVRKGFEALGKLGLPRKQQERGFEFLRDFRRAQKETAQWLFNEMGANLKAAAFISEFREAVEEHYEELKSDYDGSFRRALARRAAKKINADFGGLNLRAREGKVSDLFRDGGPRDPRVQMALRALILAPDWTESNLYTILAALKKENVLAQPDVLDSMNKNVYRTMWLRVGSRALTISFLINLLLSGVDPDRDLYDLYQQAGFFGKTDDETPSWWKFRWLDVNATLFSPSDSRKYVSVAGHFGDGVKWTADLLKDGPLAPLERKGSVAMRAVVEAITGADYSGRRFTTLREILGMDYDAGYYQRKTTLSDGTVMMPGDSKAGKYKGKLSRFSVKTGSVDLEQVLGGGYLWTQVFKFTPLQVRGMVEYILGQKDGFDLLMETTGTKYGRTYVKQ